MAAATTAAAATAARSRWAALDDALEDSDQSFRRVSGAFAPGRAGLSTRRRRPPHASAYFFETTDEEEVAAGGGSTSVPLARRASGNFSSSYSGRVGGQRALMATDGAQRQRLLELPLPPRLHIGEIRFPATRSVLWDRRVLAEPIGVSVEQVLPHVTVAAAAMKQVYHLFRERLAEKRASRRDDDDDSSADDVLCFLCGDAAAIASEKRAALVRVEKKQKLRRNKWDPNVLWVPVHTVLNKRRVLQQSKEKYAAAITSAQQAYADDKTDALTAKLQPTLLVASSTVHSAQLDLQLECPAPPLLFRFSLIRSLPLLMTPLAASLSRQEFGSGDAVRRSGYLTLDRARKAVPLLKTDPLIVQQPVVGVWVYGVPLSDEWSDSSMATQFADPYLYFACLGFISSRTIKERAEVSRNTFLVALYPSGSTSRGSQQQVSPLPRFFECSYSEHVDTHAPIPMELYTQQKSCLVGVSSFSEDVEFSLSPSPCDVWENAREQLDIPTAPAACRIEATVRREDPDVDSSSSEAGLWARNTPRSLSRVTFTDDKSTFVEAPLKRSSVSTRINQESDAKENEHPNTRAETVERRDAKLQETTTVEHSSTEQPPGTPPPKSHGINHAQRERSDSTPLGARSCCKTQALLTIQHQQILENQQRQLHEMQEQIAHLRRLLDATKRLDSDNHREEFASSRVSMPESLPPLEDSSGQDVEVAEEGRISLNTAGHSVKAESADDDDENVQDNDSGNEETPIGEEGLASDNESSLHLSSISSNASMRSDISSLSSSLVGKRMKERFRKSRSGIRFLEEPVDHPSIFADEDVSFKTSAHETEDTNELHTAQGVTKDGLTLEDSGSEQRRQGFDAQQHVRLSDDEKPEESEDNDDDDDDDDREEVARFSRAPLEKLLTPDSYLHQRGAFVDHHGGCYTAPTLDMHSFCVPRIKFPAASSATAGGYLSDSDDEEFRLIEQKYKRLLRS